MSTPEVTKVHPLQNQWSIYEQIQFYNDKDKKKGYLDSYDNICQFKTVEGFWMNWNRIPTVTQLFYDGENRIIKRVDECSPGDEPRDIKIEGQSIFKKDIQPKWEDEANSNGGEFRVVVDVSAHDTLGKFWETIVLTMIGETMDESDAICGARILDKSKPTKRQICYRLEIWFKDWKDEDFKNRLETKIRGICNTFHYDKAVYSFEQHKADKWN